MRRVENREERRSAQLSPRELARLLPDEPRWIDLRGLLLTARCDVWAEASPELGLVARSWDFPFAALYRRPSLELIGNAAAAGRAALDGRHAGDEWQLLASPEERPVVEAALPGWRRRGIALHRWQGRLEQPGSDSAAEIRLLPEGHHRTGLALDRFPEASRYELTLDWVSRRPTAVAIIDSRPVSICYAAFVTERLWDVSVETLAPFRRRGLAAASFLTLAAHMAEQRKTPTWGAMLDNPASLGLAAKLGFVRDSGLDGWSKED
jgi:hypothetical protein